MGLKSGSKRVKVVGWFLLICIFLGLWKFFELVWALVNACR